jgi:hypothetical protein
MAFHQEPGQDLVPVSSRPVQCPNCSNDVPASNVNISSLLAKCDLCGHVIQLADLNAPDEYQVEGLPGGVVEDVSPGSELSLSLSWWDEDIVGLLLFCIFWDGFLVFWYTVAFIGLSRGELDDGWGWAFFFPIVHVAIGCVLTYYVIAGFLNQTVISLTGGRLVVRHRPVRWWGERCLETSDLVGIALERSKSEESMDLTILAHQRDGRKIILLYPRAERQAGLHCPAAGRSPAGSAASRLRRACTDSSSQVQRGLPKTWVEEEKSNAVVASTSI